MPGHYWVPKAEIELAWDIANAHLPDIDWTKRVYSDELPPKFRLPRVT